MAASQQDGNFDAESLAQTQAMQENIMQDS